jgi:hypothetical protein
VRVTLLYVAGLVEEFENGSLIRDSVFAAMECRDSWLILVPRDWVNLSRR